MLIITIVSNTLVEKQPYNSDVIEKCSLNFEVQGAKLEHHMWITLLLWQ